MMVDEKHTNRLCKFFAVLICVMLMGQAVYADTDGAQETANVITVGTVSTDVLNVRESAGTDKALVGKLYGGEQVIIGASASGWYYIATSKVVGWVSGDYISDVKTMTQEEYDAQKTNIGSDVVTYARQFLGKPYRSGGNGPNSFDCSGLVKYVYGHYGISTPRSSSSFSSYGTTVSLSEAQPGDIMCYRTGGNGGGISHVGIYAGNGELIHASTSRRGVTTDSIYDSYYSSRLVKVVRVL